MIQTAFCLKSPEFLNQDGPWEGVRYEFHDVGLDGRAVSPQSGIVPIEVDRNVHRTVLAI
jgi:hypothetical protein